MSEKEHIEPPHEQENGLERKIFLGFIRIHILHHASVEEVYGMELMEELGSHGYRLSPGTLYPILHQLEEGGFLTSRKEVVNGKTRKYYRATSRGSSLLQSAREKVRELSDEILGGDTVPGESDKRTE